MCWSLRHAHCKSAASHMPASGDSRRIRCRAVDTRPGIWPVRVCRPSGLVDAHCASRRRNAEARHAALELLELADVDLDRLVAHRAVHRRRLRAVGCHQQAVSPSSTTCAPDSSGVARNLGNIAGSSTAAGQPTIVPSGSAVTADFRCRTFVTRHRHHAPHPRLEMRSQLCDAGSVGAPTQADVDGGADLQHVAAVERAGRLRFGPSCNRVRRSFLRPLPSRARGSARPGSVITARSPNITTVSSMKTASGQSSAGGHLDRSPNRACSVRRRSRATAAWQRRHRPGCVRDGSPARRPDAARVGARAPSCGQVRRQERHRLRPRRVGRGLVVEHRRSRGCRTRGRRSRR